MKALFRVGHAVLAVGVMGLFGLACTDVPTEPQARQYTETTSKYDPLAVYKSGPLRLMIGFAYKDIGPAGGSVKLGDFEVIVPPDAVSTTTRFTIRLPLDPTVSDRVFAEFGPHGAKFKKPVTLRLPHASTSASSETDVRVLWWDGLQWWAYPTSLRGDGRIETQVDHFSEYGTEATFSKGIILVGG